MALFYAKVQNSIENNTKSDVFLIHVEQLFQWNADR